MNPHRHVILCSAIALILSLTGVAMGASFDGGVSNPGDWNDPLNWDNDLVPEGGPPFGDASIGTE